MPKRNSTIRNPTTGTITALNDSRVETVSSPSESIGFPAPPVNAVEAGRTIERAPWVAPAAATPSTTANAGSTASSPVAASATKAPATGATTTPIACRTESIAGTLSPMKSIAAITAIAIITAGSESVSYGASSEIRSVQRASPPRISNGR